MERAGLAPLDQALQPLSPLGDLPQRREDGGGLGGGAQHRGAEGEGLVAGHQPGMAVLDRQDGHVEGVRPGLFPIDPRAQFREVGVKPARLRERPPSFGERLEPCEQREDQGRDRHGHQNRRGAH